MFHFAWLAPYAYVFSGRRQRITLPGCPIQKSPDQSLLAAPRGLSQLATSFIAFRHQGIHRMPHLKFENRSRAVRPRNL